MTPSPGKRNQNLNNFYWTTGTEESEIAKQTRMTSSTSPRVLGGESILEYWNIVILEYWENL